LKAPDGSIKTYPFQSSYGVGEPNVICSPTAMNVMYMGIPNPLDVSVPGISPDKIRIKVVNGTFLRKKSKTLKVRISAETGQLDHLLSGKMYRL